MSQWNNHQNYARNCVFDLQETKNFLREHDLPMHAWFPLYYRQANIQYTPQEVIIANIKFESNNKYAV